MTKKEFLTLLIEALEAIKEPRFFKSERGYQGELLAELRKRIASARFPGDPIVEQEYQKTIPAHRLTIRPDLIIHIPFDRGLARDRKEGNFVAIELKLHANEKQAHAAFENLRQIKEVLDYPLTLFVNIDSANPRAELCPDDIAEQTLCVAVRLENGNPTIRVQES